MFIVNLLCTQPRGILLSMPYYSIDSAISSKRLPFGYSHLSEEGSEDINLQLLTKSDY
jgi:hypothetical protein